MSYTVPHSPDDAIEWVDIQIDNVIRRRCKVRVKRAKQHRVLGYPVLSPKDTYFVPPRDPWYWDIPVTNAPNTARNPTGMDLSDFVVVEGPAW